MKFSAPKIGTWLIVAALLAATRLVVGAFDHPKLLLTGAGALLLAFSRRWNPTESWPWEEPVLWRPLLACLAVLAISTIFSRDPLISIFGVYRSPFFCILTLLTAATVYVSASMFEGDFDVETACALVAIPMSLYAISQALGLDPWHWALQKGRTVSTMGSPVYLGAAYAIIIPACVDLALGKRPILGWIALLLSSVGLATTYSKGGMLAAAAGFAARGLLTGEIKLKRLIIPAIAFIGLGVLYLTRLPVSDLMRFELAKISWASFKERPWLGSGPETFLLEFRRFRTDAYIAQAETTISVQASAHNDILQALVTTGIPGVLALAWLWFAVFKAAWDGKDALVFSVMAALFVQAKFNPLPIPVLAVAALFAAKLPSRRLLSETTGRVAGGGCEIIAVAGFAICVLMGAGDRAYKTATIDQARAAYHLHRAISWAPWEPHYRQELVNLRFAQAKELEPLGGRVAALLRLRLARSAYRESVKTRRLHPADPSAHEMVANSLILLTRHGGGNRLRAAAREMERAGELDPKLTTIIAARAALAKFQ